jgi:hypothetical protein
MQEQCFLIQELFLYPQIELILVIYIAHRKLGNPYKELNNPLMKIGQYAQDVKCIGHQEHITVEFVDVALEEWTITAPG